MQVGPVQKKGRANFLRGVSKKGVDGVWKRKTKTGKLWAKIRGCFEGPVAGKKRSSGTETKEAQLPKWSPRKKKE